MSNNNDNGRRETHISRDKCVCVYGIRTTRSKKGDQLATSHSALYQQQHKSTHSNIEPVAKQAARRTADMQAAALYLCTLWHWHNSNSGSGRTPLPTLLTRQTWPKGEEKNARLRAVCVCTSLLCDSICWHIRCSVLWITTTATATVGSGSGGGGGHNDRAPMRCAQVLF